jgi:hypothetical protein
MKSQTNRVSVQLKKKTTHFSTIVPFLIRQSRQESKEKGEEEE